MDIGVDTARQNEHEAPIMANIKAIKIVIDDAHLSEIQRVRERLEARDLIKVEDCIPETGTIFGEGDLDRLDEIRQVEGVMVAQEEGSFHAL
jgi:hypothetical protein